MRILIAIFLMSWVTILVTSGTVTAMSHDHHTSHHSISPFDKSNELPQHCVLKGHSINNPCPHLMKDSKSVNSITIAADCGGTPYEKQTVPQSANKQKVFLDTRKNHDLQNRYILSIVTSDYSLLLHTPLFHPPRFI